MTTEEIIIVTCGLAAGLAGAGWARWLRWRRERENRDHPAE